MLITTRSRVESRGPVTCRLGLALGLVTLKCYGLVTCGLSLGLVTLKFCGLGLATKELALGLLKMAEFTTQSSQPISKLPTNKQVLLAFIANKEEFNQTKSRCSKLPCQSQLNRFCRFMPEQEFRQNKIAQDIVQHYRSLCKI